MDTEGCSFSLKYGLIFRVLQFKGICLLLLSVEVQKKSNQTSVMQYLICCTQRNRRAWRYENKTCSCPHLAKFVAFMCFRSCHSFYLLCTYLIWSCLFKEWPVFLCKQVILMGQIKKKCLFLKDIKLYYILYICVDCFIQYRERASIFGHFHQILHLCSGMLCFSQ